MKTKFLLLLLSTMLIVSCNTDYIMPSRKTDLASAKPSSKLSGPIVNAVATPELYWDAGEIHHDFLPTPPGTPLVPAPWASGAVRQISQDVIDDYRKNDGWVLLYNTFSTERLSDHLYFVLYNKYRGLIRMYYYIPNSSNFINSDNIAHTLYNEKPYAATSPILNFSNNEPINFGQNLTFTSVVENAQVGPGTWYLFEHELAYDKNIKNQSYLSSSFTWNVKSFNIIDLQLSGTQTGTNVPTSIASITKSKFDFLKSPTADGAVKIGFATTEYATSIIKGESDASKFGAQVFSAIKGIISGAKSGFLKQLFAGVFGTGESPTIQKINLQMNTQIKLNGTLSDNFLVTAPGFAWPGYNQSNTSGYAPSYNEPLGVFYISSKPKIRVTKVKTSSGFGGGFGTTYWHYPSIDFNSFQLEFNPAVVGGNGYVQIASIQNIKREIILLNPSSIPILEHNGQVEVILNSAQYIIANPSF